jgi:Tfp pilus assembly protein PilN
MRTVYFDLIKPRPGAGVVGWFVAASGLLAFVVSATWTATRYPAVHDHLALRTRTLHELQVSLQSTRQARLPQDDKRRNEQMAAARVTAQLNSPWLRLLDVLEQQPLGVVALLTLETSPARGDFSLTAEAKDFGQMLAYVRFLQSHDTLSMVTLHMHQVNQKEREKPVRFRVTGRWSDAT